MTQAHTAHPNRPNDNYPAAAPFCALCLEQQSTKEK